MVTALQQSYHSYTVECMSYLYVCRYMIDRLHFTPEDAIEGKNLHVHSHGAGDKRTPQSPQLYYLMKGRVIVFLVF